MTLFAGLKTYEHLLVLVCAIGYAGILLALRRFVIVRPRLRTAFNVSFETVIYCLTALALSGLGSYKAAMATSYVEALKWSQFASIIGQVGLLWLVRRLTQISGRTLFAGLTSVYLISMGMHLVSVSGLFATFLNEVYVMPSPWSTEGIRLRVPLYVWQAPINLANLASVLLIGYSCLRRYREGKREHALLAGLSAVFVSAGNLHDMYLAGSVYMAPLGLLFMLTIFLAFPPECFSATPIGAGTQRDALGAGRLSGEPGEVLARRAWIQRMLWDQHPLVGVVMTLLLVTTARLVASEGIASVLVLLSLLGMMQATMSVLHRVGSGLAVRLLALVALCVIGLPQLMDILYTFHIVSAFHLEGAQSIFMVDLREGLWIVGLLVMLSAFYLAGIEAGEARQDLVVEKRQLVSEVAARRRAEVELQASEERFRALIENSTDIVAILNVDGTIRYSGASIRAVLGYDPETLSGKPVSELCHPDDAHLIANATKMILRQHGAVHSVEVRVRNSEGRWRFIEGIGKNLLADPVLNGIVVNARDITERKLMVERLESLKEDEQQRIRHDLHDTVGQDLAGLLCMAGSLSHQLENSSPEHAQQAEAIVEGVQHTMRDVRNAIQGIAPIEADPRGLETALRHLAERSRARHGIDIAFECRVPVTICDYTVSTQLFRIAQEALTNAVKHARARSISVFLFADRNRITLSVRDDGIGIAAPGPQSKGIGLYTMKSRAAAIGASLEVSERPERSGTQVLCILGRDSSPCDDDFDAYTI